MISSLPNAGSGCGTAPGPRSDSMCGGSDTPNSPSLSFRGLILICQDAERQVLAPRRSEGSDVSDRGPELRPGDYVAELAGGAGVATGGFAPNRFVGVGCATKNCFA